jgi:glyoxylase-like metal-dependent hydrolase (beta-lactamase superfamily II)
VLLRPVAQQKEMDEHGAEFIERFRNISAIYKELLQDAKMRPADVAFDSEVKLDLGDVSARLFWLGPAHTIGDELIFVEPDSALLSGDIVMSKLVPSMPTPDANPKNWLANTRENRATAPALCHSRSRGTWRCHADRARARLPYGSRKARLGVEGARKVGR